LASDLSWTADQEAKKRLKGGEKKVNGESLSTQRRMDDISKEGKSFAVSGILIKRTNRDSALEGGKEKEKVKEKKGKRESLEKKNSLL